MSVGRKGEPSNAGREEWFSGPTLARHIVTVRLAACVRRGITPPPLGAAKSIHQGLQGGFRGVINDTDMYKVRDRWSFGRDSCSAQV